MRPTRPCTSKRWYWFSYLIAFLQIFSLAPPVKSPEFPRIRCLKGNKNVHGVQMYRWKRVRGGVETCSEVCSCGGSREQTEASVQQQDNLQGSTKARGRPFGEKMYVLQTYLAPMSYNSRRCIPIHRWYLYNSWATGESSPW